MQAIVTLWLKRHRHGLLVALLITLHLALMQDVRGALGRSLFLVHMGLFLLWQPLIQAEARLSRWTLLGGVAVVAATAQWFSWWLIILWLMLLAGLVGGRFFSHNRGLTKLYYILALAYLIGMLLGFALPEVMPEHGNRVLEAASHFGFPVLIGAMLLVPHREELENTPEALDLVFSFGLILILAVLALGSIAMTQVWETSYPQALISTLFAMAGMLLLLAWSWNPRAGFSGVSALLSRHMLSVGMSFEQWLHSLAELARQEHDPFIFLDLSCKAMLERSPLISGGTWRAAGREGHFGGVQGVGMSFHGAHLELTLYSPNSLPPTLVWHFNLVAQLLAEFYGAKERDRLIAEMAYVQAVHETGARVTHDVKNLLQSLHGLIAASQQAGDGGGVAFQGLLRRQLPVITQRLQQTLAKLSQPELELGGQPDTPTWWDDLQERYQGSGIQFVCEGDIHKPIPVHLFNNGAENFLQNALHKRALESGLQIQLSLDMRSTFPCLKVCDSGVPVKAGLAFDLGKRPVASESGLGIGLFQLARTAQIVGYRLELASNESGKVCFGLSHESAH